MIVDKKTPVTVKILDKDYLIACSEDEQAALCNAAQHLDKKMREIRLTGKVHGLERVAVMAALNITYEFLQKDQQSDSHRKTAMLLAQKVDKVLQDIS